MPDYLRNRLRKTVAGSRTEQDGQYLNLAVKTGCPDFGSGQ